MARTKQQTSTDPDEARNWARALTDEAVVTRLFRVANDPRAYNAIHRNALIRTAAVRLRDEPR